MLNEETTPLTPGQERSSKVLAIVIGIALVLGLGIWFVRTIPDEERSQYHDMHRAAYDDAAQAAHEAAQVAEEAREIAQEARDMAEEAQETAEMAEMAAEDGGDE